MKKNQLISNEATYDDLRQRLIGQPKLMRRPGSVALRKKAQCIARFNGIENCLCEVFSTGYAVYDNGTNKTVIRIVDCKDAKYDTNLPLPMLKVSDETLKSAPWYIPLIMQAEAVIARNSKFPMSIGSTSDLAEKDKSKAVMHWISGKHFDTPDVVYMMKEYVEELLSVLTENEFEVVVSYYYECCKQNEIAKRLNIKQSTVSKILKKAKEKILSDIQ